MTTIKEATASRVLISDGAWGTFLTQKGLKPGECPESWCLTHYNDMKEIAAQFIAAGADMVQTNTLGATRYKLQHYGLQDKVAEINEMAARASREAAGDSIWVIASVGPTGKLLITEEVTEDDLYEAFKEQAQALEKGGVNAVCIETMSDIGEAVAAIRAAKENTRLEVMCTFTFDRTVRGDYRTMMGASPEDAVLAALEAGADIIGTNCGNGAEHMVEVAQAIRKTTDAPILVHANAGRPTHIDGRDIFPETPEEMAKAVPALIAAGANIIGGCCGTTPAHIKAMKEAVAQLGN